MAATVTPYRMRLVAAISPKPYIETEVETLLLSTAQREYLGQLSEGLNPAMPFAFGGAQAVRALLEHLENAQLDLSAASSEDDVTSIATAALRQRKLAGRR